MKNSFLKLALSVLCLFSFQTIFSQGHIHKIEIVLEVSTITSKNYNDVKNALVNTTGINFLAFCEQSKCFLLSYDPTVFESSDDIEKIIHQLDPSNKTKIKTNATVAEMIGNCTTPSTAASPALPASE